VRLLGFFGFAGAMTIKGGWQRLWIVLSILFGVPAFLIAYDINSRGFAEVAWAGDNQAFWKAARQAPGLANCDWSTAKSDSSFDGSAFVSCKTTDPLTPALLWALFPAALMAAIGLTVRWVYRGFRPTADTKVA
jgi:hypothetical protein